MRATVASECPPSSNRIARRRRRSNSTAVPFGLMAACIPQGTGICITYARLNNDGDHLTDIAFSYVFSKPQNGRQTVNVFVAKGGESRSPEAVGTKIIFDGEVSFGPAPNIMKSGAYTFFAGSRSDAFFFDFDGIKNLFDTRGKRNFTEPHLGGKSPWTGVDSNTEANVFSTDRASDDRA